MSEPLCEYLVALERAMRDAGVRQTYRGQAWSRSCRQWVYFDCYLDAAGVRARFDLAACVEDHAHRGTHDGQERGLVCTACQDGIMGRFERDPGTPVFPG